MVEQHPSRGAANRPPAAPLAAGLLAARRHVCGRACRCHLLARRAQAKAPRALHGGRLGALTVPRRACACRAPVKDRAVRHSSVLN